MDSHYNTISSYPEKDKIPIEVDEKLDRDFMKLLNELGAVKSAVAEYSIAGIFERLVSGYRDERAFELSLKALQIPYIANDAKRRQLYEMNIVDFWASKIPFNYNKYADAAKQLIATCEFSRDTCCLVFNNRYLGIYTILEEKHEEGLRYIQKSNELARGKNLPCYGDVKVPVYAEFIALVETANITEALLKLEQFEHNSLNRLLKKRFYVAKDKDSDIKFVEK